MQSVKVWAGVLYGHRRRSDEEGTHPPRRWRAGRGQGYSQAILKVEPGERQLRFFFSIAAKKVADREFEFQLLAPLGSFVVPCGARSA